MYTRSIHLSVSIGEEKISWLARGRNGEAVEFSLCQNTVDLSLSGCPARDQESFKATG